MTYDTLDQVAERAAGTLSGKDARAKKQYIDSEFNAFISSDEKRIKSFNEQDQFDSFLDLVNKKSDGALTGVYDYQTEALYSALDAGDVEFSDLPDDIAVAMAPIIRDRGSDAWLPAQADLRERVKDNFYGTNPNSTLSKIQAALLSPFGQSIWEREYGEDWTNNIEGDELTYEKMAQSREDMRQRRMGVIREMNKIAETDGVSIDTIETIGGLVGLFGGSTAAYRQLQKYGMASLLQVATKPKQALKTLAAQGTAEVAIAAPYSEGPKDTFANAALGIGFGVAGEKAIRLASNIKMPTKMSAIWGNAVDKFDIRELNRWAQPMSARVEKISPAVANGMRRFLMRTNMRAQNAQDVAADFLHTAERGIKKDGKRIAPGMSKKDFDDTLFHLANGDRQTVNQIFQKYPAVMRDRLRQNLSRVDRVNSRFLDDARAAGMDVGELDSYWARRISTNKYKQYLADKGINESDRRYQQLMRDTEIEYGRKLTDDDRAAVINKYFTRGEPLRSPSTSNVKSRQIGKVSRADYDKYYDKSDKAMMKYYENMALAIEKRNFFGVGVHVPARNGKPVKYEHIDEAGNVIAFNGTPASRRNLKVDNGVLKQGSREFRLEESAGAYVAKLIDSGQVDSKHFDELTELTRTVWAGLGATHKWSKGLSLLSYGTLMGQFDTAILQFTDTAIEAGKSGPRAVAKSFAEGNFKDVGLQSIGLEGLQMDIIDRSMREGVAAKAIDKLFKTTGLRKVDAIMKGMSARTGLSKYLHLRGKSMDSKEVKDFVEEQRKWFGEDAAELAHDISMLPKKISDGHLTEDMRLLMFNNLSQHQPVSILEFPERYAKHGGARFLYSLKSFMLKYIDNANRLTLREWKAGNRTKAVKNTLMLGGWMATSQTGYEIAREFVYDQVRALVDGRFDDFGEFYRDKREVYHESIADGLLNAVALNRYLINRGVDKPFETTVDFILGPSPNIMETLGDTAATGFKDVTGMEDAQLRDYKAMKYIPLIGRGLDRSVGSYRKYLDSGSNDLTLDPLGGLNIQDPL